MWVKMPIGGRDVRAPSPLPRTGVVQRHFALPRFFPLDGGARKLAVLFYGVAELKECSHAQREIGWA